MKFLCLIASVSAIKLQDPSEVHGTWYGDKAKILNFNDQPVLPQATHENEDYHSGPDPLSGNKYLTSTQVKYLRKDTTDLASEVKPFNPDFFQAYNAGSPVAIEDCWPKTASGCAHQHVRFHHNQQYN